MNHIAITAEYNPFHTGHLQMLRELRRQAGADAVLTIIMSGSFVQRGEPALFDKWSRAAWAVQCGADCVVELPALYALSSAEGFAYGAVSLASQLGCTALSCGVEEGSAGDIRLLAQMALEAGSHPVSSADGQSYGDCLSDRISQMAPPELAALLRRPNTLLAVEYAKAMLRRAPEMDFIPIRRHGRHDAPGTTGAFASASAIRQAIATGKADTVEAYLPGPVREAVRQRLQQGQYTDYSRYGDFVLCQSRLHTLETLQATAAFSEGLEHRWNRIVPEALSWPEALHQLKTRRYSYSRLCRMGAYTVLSVSQAHMDQAYAQDVPYARLLAASPRGTAQLRACRGTVPIISRISQARALTDWGRCLLAYDLRSTDIQHLCFHDAGARLGRQDYYRTPYIQKGPSPV